jgi:hypothetical protein
MGEEDIPENEDLGDVRATLEVNLHAVCKTDWEVQHVLSLCANDGSKGGLTSVLHALTDHIKAKRDASNGTGGGQVRGGSRYGKLAVALSQRGAVAHKAECEPAHVFRTDSTTLAAQWGFLKPPPKNPHVRPNTTWELRLTDRIWKDDDDDRRRFVLTRGREVAKEGPERDDVLNETWAGAYAWAPLLHGGDVYDDYELELELATMGNTDKHSGDGSSLTVLYRRDVEHVKVLHYSEHAWGRTTTSEMRSFDHAFPPRMTEVHVEELDDAAVDALVTMSLARLSKGAAAGVEEHGAYLPGQRRFEEA